VKGAGRLVKITMSKDALAYCCISDRMCSPLMPDIMALQLPCCRGCYVNSRTKTKLANVQMHAADPLIH
jgi:hypothetical protein